MVDRLADVVQQAGLLAKRDVGADLGGHHAAEEGDLLAVGEDVLTVAGAKGEDAEQTDQLRVESSDPSLEHCLLALFTDSGLDVASCLGHHLLDAGRVNPAVDEQMVEGDPGDFPANRVEAAQDDGLRSVVDDEVHAGGVLQGPDVTAFTPDDPPLHLVAGYGDYGDGGFSGLLGSDPLHSGHQDVPGAFVAFFLDDLLPIANLLRDLLVQLFFDAGQDGGSGLGPGQAGDTLQLAKLGLDRQVEVFLDLLDLLVLDAERLLFAVEFFEPAIERFLFLLDTLLRALQLGTGITDFLLEAGADPVGLFLGLQDHLFLLGLRFQQHLLPLCGRGNQALPAAGLRPEVDEDGPTDEARNHSDEQEDIAAHGYTSLLWTCESSVAPRGRAARSAVLTRQNLDHFSRVHQECQTAPGRSLRHSILELPAGSGRS